VSARPRCGAFAPSEGAAEGLTLLGRTASAAHGAVGFDTGMDLVKGAAILTARLAAASRRHSHREQLEWSPGVERREDLRCVSCGGAIADVLASLGSLRCHDCRSGQPQR